MEVNIGQLKATEEGIQQLTAEDIAELHRQKATVWLQSCSCPEYLAKAEECLTRENESTNEGHHSSTKSEHLRVMENELLAKQEKALLQNECGFPALLHDDMREDLARMYRLFQRIPEGLERLAETFKRCVKENGLQLAEEATQRSGKRKREEGTQHKEWLKPSHEWELTRQLVELHDRYLQCVNDCFCNNLSFLKIVKEAFEALCNKSVAGWPMAELLVDFCDQCLMKGIREIKTSEKVVGTLDKALKLLTYISDKDLFAEFCREKLARRLLLWKPTINLEKHVLTRLKEQCGETYTSKMEVMVKDAELACERQQQFEDWQHKRSKQGSIGLEVTVLHGACWPHYPTPDLPLPSEMKDGIEIFKEFYATTTKHRNLTWIYSLGQIVVKAHFDTRPIELQMSTSQAALLMLFNDDDQLSYNDIKSRLNLPDDQLSRLLFSLACGKHKILRKVPNVRKVEPTDVFQVNTHFTNRLKRVKIPPQVAEKKQAVEDVGRDRRSAIDAAIVRVMKSKRALQHQELVVEVVQQLRGNFQPDLKLVKQRIEDLIEREFLERDKEDPGVYKYLA